MRFISAIRWILVAAIVVVLATPALATTIGGRMIVEVDGESMTPTYQVGDLILIREPAETDLQVGAVVTAVDGNGDMYTHRIIELNADGTVKLQGDGNSAADPGTVGLENLRGVVELHLGQPWAALILQLQQWPLRICLLAVILGLALIPLARTRSAGPAAAPSPIAAPEPVTTTPPAETRSGRRRAQRAARAAKTAPAGSHAASRSELRRRARTAARAADAAGDEAPVFRSTYSAPAATTVIDTVADRATDPMRWAASEPVPVAATVSASAPVVAALDAALFAPVAAVVGARPATTALPAVTIDEVDDVDAVDDVANVVPGALPGYAITVVDGPDGQPRVRISVDLDSLALAAALAVAAPGPVDRSVAPTAAPVAVVPRSAGAEHVTAGVIPPLSFSPERGRRARSRHGRRRAS
ncbi:signal peptidase I [Herbiconiux sp. L3-i23]|uniref:signal peptidase I n=1 Tax=Herbiconiux sp. L3-i23 TaxID=2905871 RepID=UPI002045FBEC|nr:signal peptidase I [Herbiconiux sp. L3-i23]BDI23887.1 hypothetical protein L3i23_26630 [Herbiconiux sp. L3-i23]